MNDRKMETNQTEAKKIYYRNETLFEIDETEDSDDNITRIKASQ